jgi:hypothetical protein
MYAKESKPQVSDTLLAPFIVVLFGLAVATTSAAADGWSLSGSVGAETRFFPHNPQFPAQLSGAQGALLLNPELRYRSPDRRHLVRFAPNIRVDSRDRERSLVDVTELVWTYAGDDWETVTGINKVFWGVTESRHLVDIVNQTDLAEDIDGEEKLGQPMFSIATQRDWGRIDAFVLTGFRERTFPGPQGRLRAPLSVDVDNPEYESGAAENHVDYALRYTHYFGDWDVGLSGFHGTGREPRLSENAAGNALIPVYDQIAQLGADLQYTRDAMLYKFEGIVREGNGDTFAAAVAGFEYTLYQLRESPLDLGLLVEYLYDGRDASAPLTIYDNDVFAGARLTLNDTQDTAVLAGAVVDVDDRSTLLTIEAERRLGNDWTVEIESRWFVNAAPGNLLRSFERDDYLTLRIRRYF